MSDSRVEKLAASSPRFDHDMAVVAVEEFEASGLTVIDPDDEATINIVGQAAYVWSGIKADISAERSLTDWETSPLKYHYLDWARVCLGSLRAVK